jgi:hypothetical protein
MMRCGIAAVSLLLGLTFDARPLEAGRATALIFPFDIADAPSLPWSGGACCGRPDYDVTRLVSDTEALLIPTTPIVVRLETLRRAVIYASSDRRLAAELLTRFTQRMRPEARGATPAAIVVLDAAFVIEAIRQIEEHPDSPFTQQSRQVRGLVRGSDGYALLRAAVPNRSNDPEFEFAAALIAGATDVGQTEFVNRASTAEAWTNRDPLLARNVQRIYGKPLGPRRGAGAGNKGGRRRLIQP